MGCMCTHPPDIWFFLLALLVARRCGLSSGAPTTGLGLSAPRTCGCVGCPLFLWLWLEPLLHFSAVEFSRCLHCRAHRHGLQRSPGRSQAPLLSATVAATGVRSSSPTPLPKRAPHRRASQPVRGSVAQELSGMMLGAVSGSASKCCPPLLPESMRLSGSSTSTLPATRGPGRGVAWPFSQVLPRAPLASRVSSPVLPRPRASGGSADAPSRTGASKRKSLGAEDVLRDSIGGNVAATRVCVCANSGCIGMWFNACFTTCPT